MASFNNEGGSHVFVEVSPDIHICGFCKQQYNNFEVFLAHKQSGCTIAASDITAPNTAANLADASTEFVFEETYQTCVMRGVKSILTKAQKTPSKKLKPALTSKRRSCCFSGCTFKTQYGQKDMERHLKTHTGEKPFECELCHKRFSRRDKLNMHSRSHTGEKPHKCSYCAYAAADSSSLKKHLRIHYDERPFKCQICPYASRNSSQLTVHLRSHTGDAPFQCQECDAKFKINSDLKRHVRVHSGEKPYKCDFCEYRCAMKGNLKSHVQIKHSAAVLRCADCDFRCQNKSALRQHQRMHLPAQPVRCAACSYSCASKGALKVHERVHSEERPFKCDACGFATKQRSNLVIHRKKSHADGPGEKGGAGGGGGKGGGACGGIGEDTPTPKPAGSRYRAKLDAARAFRCELCDASFVREDSLRSHRKQHREPAPPPPQLPAPAGVRSIPGAPLCGPNTPLLLPSTDPMAAYSSAQLKIIVSHPLGPGSSFLQTTAGVAGQQHHGKTGAVLLSPASQDAVVSSMMQQVGLLTPVHRLTAGQSDDGSSSLEGSSQATLLLTPLLTPPPRDGNHGNALLHQALLQTAIASQQDPGGGGGGGGVGGAFIATCSDLEGLSALIREGGTEVTVVTEGNAPAVVAMAAPPEMAGSGPPGELPVTTEPGDSVTSCVDGGLLVPSQGMVIHSLPLIVSAPSLLSPDVEGLPH